MRTVIDKDKYKNKLDGYYEYLKDNYLEKAQANLGESIQYIQNTIMGECQKVDITEYVKTK